jgi:hypothetical protein
MDEMIEEVVDFDEDVFSIFDEINSKVFNLPIGKQPTSTQSKEKPFQTPPMTFDWSSEN